MGRATYGHKSIIADKAARRAAAIDRIRAVLARMPMSSRDIADLLDMTTQTVHGYLVHLESEGMARKSGLLDRTGRLVWTEASPDDVIAAEHGARALVVPARQVGMQRDPLVAALFGPANQQR